MFIFFFFQAEDGIRDVAVTGVQTCALPIFNLVELIRVPAAQVADRLEYIGAALVMRRRGSLLPIVYLRDLLGHSAPTPEQSSAGAVHILVVAAGDLHYGLIVDALLDSEEIVVKPLGQH